MFMSPLEMSLTVIAVQWENEHRAVGELLRPGVSWKHEGEAAADSDPEQSALRSWSSVDLAFEEECVIYFVLEDGCLCIWLRPKPYD